MHKPFARRAYACLAISALSASLCAPAWAQATYGTVSLDASLADASAKVAGVLNKHPVSNADLGFCEGPSVDAAGNIFFTEQAAAVEFRILKVTSTGQGSEFATGFNSNGTEFAPNGKLTVAQVGAIATYDGTGNRTVLADIPDSIRVNDLTIGSTGAMFYSNWGKSVWYRSAGGAITESQGFSTSNGIEWIEERGKLLVSQDGPDQVWIYNVAANGTLSNGKTFVSVAEPDGITVDEKGNIYIASWQDGKVHVFDSTAKSLGTIIVNSAGNGQGTTSGQGGNASNCIIGLDKKLYISGDGGLYSVQLKVGPRVRPIATGIRSIFNDSKNINMRISQGIFNPHREGVFIRMSNANGKRYSIQILDVKMREVWSSSFNYGALEWRGQASDGTLMASGRYIIVARSSRGILQALPVDLVRK